MWGTPAAPAVGGRGKGASRDPRPSSRPVSRTPAPSPTASALRGDTLGDPPACAHGWHLYKAHTFVWLWHRRDRRPQERLEALVATLASPTTRSRLVAPSRCLPEPLVIACPGAVAGCCLPGRGWSGSVPQRETVAAGAQGIPQSAPASSSLQSTNRNLELQGCAEH